MFLNILIEASKGVLLSATIQPMLGTLLVSEEYFTSPSTPSPISLDKTISQIVKT